MSDLITALRAKIKSLRSEHVEEKGLWYHGFNCALLHVEAVLNSAPDEHASLRAKLEVRVRELEDSGVKSIELRLALHDKFDGIIKERDKLLALLQKHEWCSAHPSGDYGYCPECHRPDHAGHRDECALGNAMKESG